MTTIYTTEDIIEYTIDELYLSIDKNRMDDDEYVETFFDENIDTILYNKIDEIVSYLSPNENKTIIEHYYYDVFEAIKLYEDTFGEIQDLFHNKPLFYSKLSYVVLLTKIQEQDYVEDITLEVLQKVTEYLQEEINEEDLIDFHRG